MASVQLQNIVKQFDQVCVTDNVSLDIEDGEFIVFVGPSGCGKSTLLRLIAGLEDISSGCLKIDGDEVNHLPPKDREVGMVFQSYALYPHLNVEQNMGFGLKLAGIEKLEIEKRVREVAQTLQLEPLLARKPKDLSGGQRQRVAIGRTLVRQPKVFLFDEPLSNLDASLRVRMRIEISRLHKRLGATMIYVTHDQVEAMTLADRIVVLDAGRLAQVGAPLELYNKPANKFVAGFIGSPQMNFLPAVVTVASPSSITLALNNALQQTLTLPISATDTPTVGDQLTLGVRPEHLFCGAELPHTEVQLTTRVDACERLGDMSLVYLQSGADNKFIILRSQADLDYATDAKLSIGFSSAHCHLFDAQGDSIALAL